MAWARRWRIDSRWKWTTILRALLDMAVDFERHPTELIVRPERRPIEGWRRRLFHAACAELAPHWGLTPGETKTKVKEDFYGTEVIVQRGRLTAEELIEFKRLLDKLGHYQIVVQSTEDSDDEEYERLTDHLYLMASESGFPLADRRTK